jgi:beta-xylosidase
MLPLVLALTQLIHAKPIHLSKRDQATDVLNGHNFPDPTLIRVDGRDYAFGTRDQAGHAVPLVSSTDFSNPASWSAITDAFPPDDVPAFHTWAAPGDVWAPDVVHLTDWDGSFAMYYSPALASNPAVHCIGVARSRTVAGPYNDSSTAPWICPEAEGGAIDAAGFRDPGDGARYVVYKVDGPAAAGGGFCANAANRPRTPIMLQATAADGYTKLGAPVQLLDNEGEADSFQTEAPSLLRSDEGVYFLFFSTGCYDHDSYATRYVTSVDGVAGPYGERRTLLATGDFGHWGPGGADVDDVEGSGRTVYHSLKVQGTVAQGRVMNTAMVTLSGRTATIG